MDNLITRFPLLFDLIKNMPLDVMRECKVCKYDYIATILVQDYPVEYVYLICSGRLIVEYTNKDGLIYDFVEIVPRQFVGEMEVIAGEPFSFYTVKVLEKCEVIGIPRDSFLKWINNDAAIAIYMLKTIASKWKETAYKATAYKCFNAKYKVVAFIINNVIHHEKDNDVYIIKDTRQIIAYKTGLCTKTVDRVVKSLQEDCYVKICKGKIWINKSEYIKLYNELKSIHSSVLSKEKHNFNLDYQALN